jgi:hypothetical protein
MKGKWKIHVHILHIHEKNEIYIYKEHNNLKIKKKLTSMEVGLNYIWFPHFKTCTYR